MLAATKLISAVSPGFSGQPTALIIIGTDTEKAVEEQVQLERHATTWIDIGTAAMNLQIAAHALGLDSTPVTSFSRSGVSTVMELPSTLIPELILQLRHPAPGIAKRAKRPRKKLTIDELTHWERISGRILDE